MAFTFLPTVLLLPFISSVLVNAETHTVQFDNQCGFGTPQLIQGTDVLTTTQYTFDTSYSGIAYLQTGDCGFNGENCPIIEMTLINPVASEEGSGSSVDISLISPHAYNSTSYKFAYYDGCDGQGAECDSADCASAFHDPDQTFTQVACQTDNVNLLITFCYDGDSSSSSSVASSSASASSETATGTSATSTESTETASSVSSESTSTSSAESISTTAVESVSATSSATSTAASSTSSTTRKCRIRKRSEPKPASDNPLFARAAKAHRRRGTPSRLH